jgi:aspartate 1-decarboxylase
VYRTVLASKIHRATVTRANLHNVGSITLNAELLRAANPVDGEQVRAIDGNNGTCFVTYVIEGERGSGVIGVSGGGARPTYPGDLVTIIGYGLIDDVEVGSYQPNVVLAQERNRITSCGNELDR